MVFKYIKVSYLLYFVLYNFIYVVKTKVGHMYIKAKKTEGIVKR